MAIILVILYHNFNFIEYFNYGWIGVDLFFVLSGFLITDILLTTLNSGNYFRNFYARRILRIFPLYYLSLILFIFLLPLIPGYPLQMDYYRENSIWFFTYLQNWTLIFDYDGRATALNHYWSLAVEEQFYLVWPFVILFIRKPNRLLIFCLTTLILIIAIRLFIWNEREFFPSWQWLFLFTRIDGILIGSMLAIMHHINPNLLRRYFTGFIIFLTAANYAFYFINRSKNFEYPAWAIAGYTTFSAIFALVAYEVITNGNRLIVGALSLAPLRFIGKYSYGFYIFHWPIFLIAKPYTDRLVANFLTPNSIGFLIFSAILATGLAFVVSVASFHFFEKHFLKLKKYFTR